MSGWSMTSDHTKAWAAVPQVVTSTTLLLMRSWEKTAAKIKPICLPLLSSYIFAPVSMAPLNKKHHVVSAQNSRERLSCMIIQLCPPLRPAMDTHVFKWLSVLSNCAACWVPKHESYLHVLCPNFLQRCPMYSLLKNKGKSLLALPLPHVNLTPPTHLLMALEIWLWVMPLCSPIPANLPLHYLSWHNICI